MTVDRERSRQIVNALVDMLMDESIDPEDILDRLELTDEEKNYFDLNWLR